MSNVIIGGCTFSDAFSDAFELCMDGVSASFEVNSPDILFIKDINVSVNQLSSNFEILQTEVFTDFIVNTSSVSANFNIPSPSVLISTEISTDIISATFNIEPFVAEIIPNIQVSSNNSTFNILDFTNITDSNVLVDTNSSIFSVNDPMIFSSDQFIVFPITLSSDFIILEPIIFTDSLLTGQTSSVFNINDTLVSTEIINNPALISANFQILPFNIITDGTNIIDGLSANFQILQSNIISDGTTIIDELSANFQILPSETIVVDAISPNELSANFSLPPAQIIVNDFVIPTQELNFNILDFDVKIVSTINVDTMTSSYFEILEPIEIQLYTPIDIPSSAVTDLYFVLCTPQITVDGDNLITCYGSLPNSYWDKETKCHDGEKELYDTLQMDAWNTWGISMQYYIVDWNSSYDKIYGEDRDRYALRTFSFKGALEHYPDEKQNYTQFGIEGLDNFVIYISIDHFSFVSTFDENGSTCYEVYIPKEGDIIRLEYSGLYYEIVHVVLSTNQFLQTKHSYTVILRVFKDIHISLSPQLSNDPLSAFTDRPDDILDISSDIDDEKGEYLYNSSASFDNPIPNDPYPPINDDPFGRW